MRTGPTERETNQEGIRLGNTVKGEKVNITQEAEMGLDRPVCEVDDRACVRRVPEACECGEPPEERDEGRSDGREEDGGAGRVDARRAWGQANEKGLADA